MRMYQNQKSRGLYMENTLLYGLGSECKKPFEAVLKWMKFIPEE
jgi:hypothetical protein